MSSNGDLTGVDLLLDIAGVLAVNSAADGHAGAEDFLDGTLEASGVALGAHLLGDLEDLVELDLAVVDNVLGLLAITWGFRGPRAREERRWGARRQSTVCFGP